LLFATFLLLSPHPLLAIMAPMKRATKSRKSSDPIKSRCKLIKEAISDAHDVSTRVKDMLASTLHVTAGAYKVDRSPLNQRFVVMIGEVMKAELARYEKDVRDKEAAFAELTPAKSTREEALDQAKADAAAKTEALEQAKQAVAEAGAKLKEASAALKEAEKAQKSGDADVAKIEKSKALLEGTVKDSLAPLVEGTTEGKEKKAQVVLEVGKNEKLDASLLQTAEPVLLKEVADRGTFDATCLEQLQAAFASHIAVYDGQLAEHAPAKAERAAAVEQADATKKAAEASLEELKEKAKVAKEAKGTADGIQKAASQSLDDFIPDIKNAGDALDEAKEDLHDFIEGASKSFDELKDAKDGDFIFEIISGTSYYETIDGMKLDRGIIDACRTCVQDGQISLEDAKRVLEAVADGGKETKVERWTMRYCLQEFKWVEGAHDWIVEELKKVKQGVAGSPAKKARTSTSDVFETCDGCKCKKSIIEACREASAVEGHERLSVDDAKKIWEKAIDGTTAITDVEKWSIRYCLAEFKWSRAAYEQILGDLHKAA